MLTLVHTVSKVATQLVGR